MRREFRAWQEAHPNFMTPTIHKFKVVADYVVEWSYGGFLRSGLQGITVVRHLGDGEFETARDLGFNKCFVDDYEGAMDYYEMVIAALEGGGCPCTPGWHERDCLFHGRSGMDEGGL